MLILLVQVMRLEPIRTRKTRKEREFCFCNNQHEPQAASMRQRGNLVFGCSDWRCLRVDGADVTMRCCHGNASELAGKLRDHHKNSRGSIGPKRRSEKAADTEKLDTNINATAHFQVTTSAFYHFVSFVLVC